jgi:hypothetical protein
MVTTNHRTRFYLSPVAVAVCALLVAVLLQSLTKIARADLPPRPLPQPLSPSAPQPSPTGGFIELRVAFPQTWQPAAGHWQEMWTVVQWQDDKGVWRDVDGWQGTLDEVQDGQGKKVWWVTKADLGKGPFRWVVTRGPGGAWLVVSESFHLPTRVGETVPVQVSLAP